MTGLTESAERKPNRDAAGTNRYCTNRAKVRNITVEIDSLARDSVLRHVSLRRLGSIVTATSPAERQTVRNSDALAHRLLLHVLNTPAPPVRMPRYTGISAKRCPSVTCENTAGLKRASTSAARVRERWRVLRVLVHLVVVVVATPVLGACFSRPGFMVRTSPAVTPLVNGSRAEVASRVAELERSTTDGTLKGGALRNAQSELGDLRSRLETGDFQIGDQIIVTLLTPLADAPQVDTASVRAGMLVAFGSLQDVSVAGVLRSEIQPRMQAHVDRFFKGATVRVNLTTRLLLMGQVAQPGFYNISPDRPASEILRAGGGLTPLAQINEVTIRRDNAVIVKPKQWQAAVKVGTTVGELGLRPGDTVEIAGRRQFNWGSIFQLGFFAVSGFFALVQLLRFLYSVE